MKTDKRTRMRPDAVPLSRQDWLAAAHAAVVEGGFDQLRVLPIARSLGVSRGSFYWHFNDHAELKGELLARWRDRQIDADRSLQGESSADPQADLVLVLDAALAHVGPDLESLRFEMALRGLGRREPAVAALLAEVDTMRLRLFERKFMRLTGDARTAAELASLFYLAVVGCHQALSRPANAPQLKDYLKRLITRYLIQQQAPPPSSSARTGSGPAATA
jgi:AcrR family transcriptional regulator